MAISTASLQVKKLSSFSCLIGCPSVTESAASVIEASRAKSTSLNLVLTKKAYVVEFWLCRLN